ncbi:hypothetical protein ACFYTG_08340 [Streptomyces mirabilis]|uniref:TRADD-N-associated membrane domain-containing protein n=1 Tax=Streptomyces mirabilis TaxID=68239 RepID=UPI0036B63D21
MADDPHSDSGREGREDGPAVVAIGSGVQYGDVNISYGYPHPAPPEQQSEVEDPRQRFLNEFRLQALGQAETTFRLSVVFMSAGAVILLAGGVLALVRHGSSAGSAAALMTSLAGVLIGTCGGAFAVHANRARRHLTVQAERIDRELTERAERVDEREQSDRTFEKVLALIDRVGDPGTQDRLRSMLAMQALELAPEPNNAARMVLPGQDSRTPEIETAPEE